MDIYEALGFIKDREKTKKVIIDTDACNEVDDQFAIAYAIAADNIDLLSVNAAPFKNENSVSFENGMEKSYLEIKRVLAAYRNGDKIPVFKGARLSMTYHGGEPQDSPAARNIIRTVKESDEPVTVLSIGACTNVISAILLAPEIKKKLIVLWLGAAAFRDEVFGEFNMNQDFTAARKLIDSGALFMLCPAWGVAEKLWTDLSEFREILSGKNAMCTLLLELIREYHEREGCPEHFGRIIWDIITTAQIACPECGKVKIIPAPVLTSDHRYEYDDSRHKIMYLEDVDRDMLYEDLWKKLTSFDFGGEYIPRRPVIEKL